MTKVKFIKKLGDKYTFCYRDVSQSKTMTEEGWQIEGAPLKTTTTARVSTVDPIAQAKRDIEAARQAPPQGEPQPQTPPPFEPQEQQKTAIDWDKIKMPEVQKLYTENIGKSFGKKKADMIAELKLIM